MILISHRGNISGPNLDKENRPEYIQQALNEGYNVEIDVWYQDQGWFLGHDKPQHLINIEYLKKSNIWCHAKNLEALYRMSHYDGLIYFWHENDTATLTSNGYIWTYPGKSLTPLSIAVLPETNNTNISQAAGVCSDFIYKYKI